MFKAQGSEEEWCWRNPVPVLQLLTFLYHNVADFAQLCCTEDALVSLASTLFIQNDADTLLVDESLDDDTVIINNPSSEPVMFCRL